MPRLSDSMEEGTILKWLKSPGEEVSRGEALVEIETDKATMTYESDASGRLEIVAAEGDTLPIGAVIARLGAPADASQPAGDTAGEVGATSAQAQAEAQEPGAAAGVQGVPPAVAAPEQMAAAVIDVARAGGSQPGPPAAAVPPAQTPAAAAPTEATPAAPTTPPAAQPAAAAEPGPVAPMEPTEPTEPTEPGERIRASPIARRIARERGVDLAGVRGSGPGGRVVRADVEREAAGRPVTPPAAERFAPLPPAPPSQATPAPPAATPTPVRPAPAAAPAAPEPPRTGEAESGKGIATSQEPTRAQQVIARRMASSKATIPEFTLNAEIDMERCVELRSRLKALPGERVVPSYNDLVVKACGLALREHPRANGAWRDGHFELFSRVNVGVAVAGEGVLVVPTVFDADLKSLAEIAGETRRLAGRVRDAQVTPPELSGATFTVSNLGMFGVKSFTAVINPPQAAILAVGAVTQRALVVDGELAVRHAMDVTLACDHRILYGADAARLLARIRELIEEPLALMR
jgi:pyruvate dehydrogenase E2 component (dihydrolipoamide acetyltransferase)